MSHRQCGVSLPGGADALVHFRRCLEQAAGGIHAEAVAILDLDLRNAFPSIEWQAVRSAVQELAPELGPWTRWCHGAPAQVQLPCGQWISCDRGAEQGDPLGPAYCGLVLADVLAQVRQDLGAAADQILDMWFMDDG